MEIEGIRLVQTCGACPEQYDAFHGEELIGYLRLRHGSFRASYPDAGGRIVYSASPEGDGLFEHHERARYLTAAVRALKRVHGLSAADDDEIVRRVRERVGYHYGVSDVQIIEIVNAAREGE